ncbi:ribonuclease HII [Candidatus Micrarchaeota archaeon]|nr:ribonuclease HII [Candidatus Micrarchaeota archaeon]
MNIIGGIDEAGRGPVIGPLIIAIATCKRSNEKKLKELASKDSKQLSPKQREETLIELRKICEFREIEVSATQINKMMKEMSLNDIEAKFMAQLVQRAGDADIMIDMPDRYSWTFKERMAKFGAHKFEAQHKADANYPIVAAASIFAKVTRDQRTAQIREITGVDFGSGYPSDPKTKKAIENKEERTRISEYLRWEWKTLENIKQTKLFENEERE